MVTCISVLHSPCSLQSQRKQVRLPLHISSLSSGTQLPSSSVSLPPSCVVLDKLLYLSSFICSESRSVVSDSL